MVRKLRRRTGPTTDGDQGPAAPAPAGKVNIERPSQVLDRRDGPPSTDPATVVVFGLPRGGTTMVAGLAQRVGVDMGANLPVNLEDPEFGELPVDQLVAAIRRNNATKQLWGWKYPLAARYLPQVHPEIRNPHYVIVCRDLLASSIRMVRRGVDFTAALQGAQRRQQANLDVLTSLPAKYLLVSYEKGVQKPVALTRDIAAFCGGQVTAQPQEIRAFAGRGSYKEPRPAP